MEQKMMGKLYKALIALAASVFESDDVWIDGFDWAFKMMKDPVSKSNAMLEAIISTAEIAAKDLIDLNKQAQQDADEIAQLKDAWDHARNENNRFAADNADMKQQIVNLTQLSRDLQTDSNSKSRHMRTLAKVLSTQEGIKWYSDITASIKENHITFDGRTVRDYINSFALDLDSIDVRQSIDIIMLVRSMMEINGK